MNKVASIQIAERQAETDQLVWVDNDILFAGEPEKLKLDPKADIAASPGSRHGGTTGPEDPAEALWRRMCQSLGLDVEALPWLDAEFDETRVRLYFNAGLCTWRRGCGFAEAYRNCLERILAARFRCRQWGLNLLEQAAFSLAIFQNDLRYQLIPTDHNFHVGPGLEPFYCSEVVRRARVLHYHRSMTFDYWPRLLEMLERDRPDLYHWLKPYGPIDYRKQWRHAANWSSNACRMFWKACRHWHELRCETV
jgi:hypothetical protein